jgi:uncharacterized membrane protein
LDAAEFPPAISVIRLRIGVCDRRNAVSHTAGRGLPSKQLKGVCVVAAVTVLKFSEPDGAQNALSQIQSLQKDHLIKVHDAAIVSWPRGKKSPKTRQLVDLVTIGAMSGMFWGFLLGIIFLTPLFGIALGTAFGALGGMFRDYGIDDDFIKRVRSAVTEGTSALFLMTSDAVIDRVSERMKNTKFEIIATNLSKDQEDKLRELFAEA